VGGVDRRQPTSGLIGPDKTTVAECHIDPRVGGRIYVVTEAGEEMGDQGTPVAHGWHVHPHRRPPAVDLRLSVLDRGRRADNTIHHTNDITFTDEGGTTKVTLQGSITEIGPKAKMAAFGMKWGYKSQVDALERHLSH
jgi:hypothetical protein